MGNIGEWKWYAMLTAIVVTMLAVYGWLFLTLLRRANRVPAT